MTTSKIAVIYISLLFLVSCTIHPTDKAADELCSCLKPLSQVIKDGKKDKDKSIGDYFDIFGKGLSKTGHLIDCLSDLEDKYEGYNDKDEWQDDVEERARKRCPKVFDTFKNL